MTLLRSLLPLGALLALAPLSAAQWSDNFDGYLPNVSIEGQGGWTNWDNNNNGYNTTSDFIANSPNNSLKVTGSNDVNCNQCSDTVNLMNGPYTSGQWTFRCMQYIPSSLTGDTYVIMLNTFGYGGPYNWSLQLKADPSSGLVTPEMNAAAILNTTNMNLPIQFDQWVEVKCLIDLDNDVAEVFYDGQALQEFVWSQGVSGGGVAEITCLDLFPFDSTVTEVYYDDFSLTAGIVGGPIGTNYCVGNPNSTGVGAAISAAGNDDQANGPFAVELSCGDLPPNQFGYFIAAQGQAITVNPGGSQGILCVALPTARLLTSLQSSGASGTMMHAVDVNSIPLPPSLNVAIAPGDTWYFQCWYRDLNPSNTSNFSDAISVTFQ